VRTRPGLRSALLTLTLGLGWPAPSEEPRSDSSGVRQTFQYEDRASGPYRFQGFTQASDGSDPCRDLARFVPEGGEPPRLIHRYRILKTTPTGTITIREIRSEDLPVDPATLECDWASGRCGGLQFLAFNPRRQEAYLTLVVDAARLVTRDLFAVSLGPKRIRRLGTFATAGDTFFELQLSPSGRYLAFLGLRGPELVQGVILVDTEAGRIRNLPQDEVVKDFVASHPGQALRVTGYRWLAGDRLVFRQTIIARPRA
jgi:hypothetical protein